MHIHELNKTFRRYFPFNAPIDMLMTMVTGPMNAQLDIIKLDEEFANRDNDYNPQECTYKEHTDISMSEYIMIKYGEEAHNFIKNYM